MSIIESVKAAYSSTGEKAQLYDETFKFLWSSCSIEAVTLNSLDFDASQRRRRLPSSETYCRYQNKYTVKITPLREEKKRKICGYLLLFYDIEDVRNIYAHSVMQKDEGVLLGNVRDSLSALSFTADKLRVNSLYYSTEAARDMRRAILKTLSCTTNHSILNHVISGRMKPIPVMLSRELEHSAQETSRHIGSELCELNIDIAPNVVVKTDWYLLESAVLNLLVNAYMYNSALKKIITLKLEQTDNTAVITVSDNGTSANLERIEKLSHFSNREIESREQECLGLVIARCAAEQFGGSISFSQTPTGGLAVEMQLPIGSDRSYSLFSEHRMLPFIVYEYQFCILSKGVELDV